MNRADRLATTHSTHGFGRGLLRMWSIVAGACLFAQLVACGSTSVSDENARLRRQNLELNEKVKALEGEILGRDGQIAALQAKIKSPGPAVEGVKASDFPVVSKLAFGGYSGAFDSDGDGRIDTVRVYLHTLDQNGRFYPAVGKAVLQVVRLDADQPPKQLARKAFDAKAFSNAYVSGFTGTHFTLEVKLEPALARDMSEITIQVTYTDAATGAALNQQMVAKLQ